MKFQLCFIAFCLFFSFQGFSQSKRHKYSLKRANEIRKKVRANIQLARALELIKKQDYQEGAKQLFMISQSPKYRNRRSEIRYQLGMALLKMELLSSASFQFLSVVKKGNRHYTRLSLERLSEISARVGSEQAIQFAIRKGGARKVKGKYRDALYYQFGKYEMNKKNYKKAVSYFNQVSFSSPVYDKAMYSLGLSYAEQKKNRSAVGAFSKVLSKNKEITDPIRVAALMGIARVYYQAKKWDLAIRHYRQVPRDTSYWHDMLFENSWALLRAGKFRSALNGFQTLHSNYYDDVYQPGSLLLRAIIYMYICKYDEMKKMLTLFKRTYSPVHGRVRGILSSSSSLYYSQLLRSLEGVQGKFPLVIAQRIYREGDFNWLHKYIKSLQSERNTIKGLPYSWRASKVGRYALRLVDENLRKSQKQINRVIRRHLVFFQSELNGFVNQERYLRYESLRGKREQLKKKITAKHLGSVQIIEGTSRDFFVKNGFEFYPFLGEYWLDELGNYHYVGTQSCR